MMPARALVTVLVEKDGQFVKYVDWSGSTKKAIMAAARVAYPDCKLTFGRVLYGV